MAFNRGNLFCTSGTSGDAPRVYSYGTTDSLDTVLASGYFNDAFRLLRANDIIQVVANGDMKQLKIVSSSSVLVDSTIASSSAPRYRKYVRQASDFDSPIRSDVEYFIDGVIDMGSTSLEVPATGINISGYDFDVSKLTSSENNYTMFTSPGGGSGNFLFKDVAFEVTGTSSQLYNLTDATGNNAFECARVNYNNCTSLGEINGYRQGLETGTGRFGGTPELTLSGSWAGGYFIETSIVRSLTAGSYSLFKAGAGFSMASRFRSNQNIDLPAGVSFFDFSPSQFVNPSTVQIQGAIITREGAFDPLDALYTPNMTEADLSSAWSGNNGMPNTFEGGSVGVTTSAATTISVQGDFYDVNASAWTTLDLQHFDSPAGGQLRHLGNTPREYKVVADFTMESAANNQVDLKVVKWDDSASGFVDILTQKRQVNSLVGARDVAFFNININVELDQNDYIKLQVANQSSISNITAEVDSYYIIEER